MVVLLMFHLKHGNIFRKERNTCMTSYRSCGEGNLITLMVGLSKELPTSIKADQQNTATVHRKEFLIYTPCV